MARYIDADKAILDLKNFSIDTSSSYGCGYSDCLTAVEDVLSDFPTADVVPKSEVAILNARYAGLAIAKNELQFEFDTYKGANKILDDNMAELIKGAIDQAKQEVAREIFEEIYEDCFDQFGYINYDALAELKKKYTE